MSRKKKKRKKKYQKKYIRRGDTEGGDFILNLAHYVEHHIKYFGTHPFDGLDEDGREQVIDAMRVAVQYKGLDPQKDGDEYHAMFERLKEAVIRHPNTPPDERIGGILGDIDGRELAKQFTPTYKGLASEARSLLDAHPELKEMIEKDSGVRKAMHAASEIFRLPGPQTLKGPRCAHGRDLIVELYHRTLDMLRTGRPVGEGFQEDTARQLNNRLWGLISEASIFEINTELYEKLKATAVNHVCAQAGIGSLLEYDVIEAFARPMGDKQKFMSMLSELSELQDMPEHFPFDTLYFALDRPLQMHPDEAKYLFKVPSHLIEGCWVYAFVVTPKEAYTLLVVDDREKGYSSISAMPEFGPFQDPSHKKRWGVEVSFNAFIFPWLIEWVNGHQTTIDESRKFSYRRGYKKTAAKFRFTRPIPRPYYTVYIRDERLEEFDRQKRIKARRKCEHQYAVRGTWVCRIARGPLPLDPKLEKQLRRDKRRKLFITEKPDPETAEHLMKRGIPPKRVDEWLSVLLYWRSDHKRGPEDAPFIPSIRKSARKEEAA